MKFELIPEEIVLAVLSQVKADIVIDDEEKLAELFNEAAEKDEKHFGVFAWDADYRDSAVLRDALTNLDSGESIARFNAKQHCIELMPPTSGGYGKGKFESLPAEMKSVAKMLAGKIDNAFGSRK